MGVRAGLTNLWRSRLGPRESVLQAHVPTPCRISVNFLIPVTKKTVQKTLYLLLKKFLYEKRKKRSFVPVSSINGNKIPEANTVPLSMAGLLSGVSMHRMKKNLLKE